MIKYFALIVLTIVGIAFLQTFVLAIDIEFLNQLWTNNDSIVKLGFLGFAGVCLVLQLIGDLLGMRRRKRQGK